ncbi:MAG: TRAP transporter substrate-binding protein [Alphaproteobacteria bacterium]
MKNALFTGVVLALTGLTAAAHGQEKLRFAVFTPAAEMVSVVLAKPWAAKVNQDARGEVDVQVYPDGALGRNPGLQTKMVQDGLADIAFVITSYTPGAFPDDDLFELPNVIQSSTEGSLSAWRLYRKGLLRGFDNYYVVTLFTSPPVTFHTNFKATTAEHLKGKKIRATGSIANQSIKALGASPEGLPATQIVEAISRGVIDGTTTHPIIIEEFGISRVVNNHYLGKIGVIVAAILMNKKKFDSLPANARVAIEKHSGEQMSRLYGEGNDKRTADVVKAWTNDPKRNVTIPTAADEAAWDKVLAPVRAAWEAKDERNKMLLKAMRQELADIRAGK